MSPFRLSEKAAEGLDQVDDYLSAESTLVLGDAVAPAKELGQVLMPFNYGQNQNRVVCDLVEEEIGEAGERPHAGISEARVKRYFVSSASFRLACEQVACGLHGINEA